MTTLLEGISVGVAALSAAAAGGLGWVHVHRPALREYTPPPIVAGAPQRFEFLREEKGQFVPTGELVPLGVDPHQATQERQKRDGIAYAASVVNNVNLPVRSDEQ